MSWQDWDWEKDCLISHGVSSFLQERLFYMSDFYQVNVCNACGSFGKLKKCVMCNSDDLKLVCLPYASELLMHSIMACGIKCKISAQDELLALKK